MTVRVAFLAFTQAHQFLHWIPVALRLSREPDVEVTVLSSNRASLDFIKGYDTGGRLNLRYLWVPTRKRGLFNSIAQFEGTASERQVQVILDFIHGKIRGREHCDVPDRRQKLTSLAFLLPRSLRVKFGLAPNYEGQESRLGT